MTPFARLDYSTTMDSVATVLSCNGSTEQ